jgi:hypothetical protein
MVRMVHTGTTIDVAQGVEAGGSILMAVWCQRGS